MPAGATSDGGLPAIWNAPTSRSWLSRRTTSEPTLGVAVISKPEYVSIINEAGLLDRAVSPYYATMNAFLRFVRGASILAVTLLQGVPGELLEVHVSAGSRWVGKALKTARLPKQAIVAAIVRGEDASIGTGETVLQEGDQVIVFAPLGAASKLESVFRR